jgi:hypothetical protein
LSRSCLDWESQSRRRQRVRLNSWENLDSVKKCASTVKKSRSRSRLLDFVSTSMSRPKSLDRDRDREIHRDLKISAFLDNLSRSRSRSAWILAFSHRDFSIHQDFSSFSDSKGLDNVKISQQCQDFSTNLDCVSTNLDNLDKNLDWKVWILKISTEKKKFGLDSCENLDTLKKLVSTLRTVSISISIGLDCQDPQAYNKTMTD